MTNTCQFSQKTVQLILKYLKTPPLGTLLLAAAVRGEGLLEGRDAG
jgi:hypothetical protein